MYCLVDKLPKYMNSFLMKFKNSPIYAIPGGGVLLAIISLPGVNKITPMQRIGALVGFIPSSGLLRSTQDSN